MTPDVIAYHQPGHQVSKQYAELWTTMIAGLPAAATCCCSPARPHVGATTVLVNLAVTSALQTKRRTAIIDPADAAARPGRTLGDQPEMGLLDVIAGQAALEQTVVKTLVPSLHALPMAQPRRRADDSGGLAAGPDARERSK